MAFLDDYRNLDVIYRYVLLNSYISMVTLYIPSIHERIASKECYSGVVDMSPFKYEIELAIALLSKTEIFTDEELNAIDWIYRDIAMSVDNDPDKKKTARTDPICKPFWDLRIKADDALEIWDVFVRNEKVDVGLGSDVPFDVWADAFIEQYGLKSLFAALEAGVPVDDVLAG